MNRSRVFILALMFAAVPAAAQDTGTVERNKNRAPGSRDRPGPSREDPPFIGQRILFLLDASGSMAIGGRFEAGKAKLNDLVQGLDDEAEVAIALFHERLEKQFGGSYIRASDGFKDRLAKTLKKLEVRADRATDFEESLSAAARRQADVIVLISDGVITEGERELKTLTRLFDAVIKKEAPTRLPKLHAYAIQAGAYGPRPSCEDKTAGADLLETLAVRRAGRYAALSGPASAAPVYRPPALKGASEPVIEPRYYKSRKPISASVLGANGQFPAFHVRVTDPALLRGDLAIAEYLSDLSLVVEYFDAVLGRVVRKAIPFKRKGARLASTRYLKAVGSQDTMEEHGSHLDKRVYLSMRKGGSIRIIYTRAGQAFVRHLRVNPR